MVWHCKTIKLVALILIRIKVKKGLAPTAVEAMPHKLTNKIVIVEIIKAMQAVTVTNLVSTKTKQMIT